MTHCSKCGCLDNVGEAVTCEDCTDKRAHTLDAMECAVRTQKEDMFHRSFLLMIIKELR